MSPRQKRPPAAGLLLAALICAPPQGRAADIPTHSLIPGKAIGDGIVLQLAHSPDGRLLAILTTVGFQVRDAEDGRLLNSVLLSVPMARALNWSPDGKRLALAAAGVEIWDPLAAAPEHTLPSDPQDGDLDEVAWSPDGKQLAAGSKLAVAIFDLASGARTVVGTRRDRSSRDIALQNTKGGFSWSPDSSQLAVVSGAWTSEVIDLWNPRQQKLVRKIPVSNGKEPVCNSDACDYASLVLSYPKSLVAWSPDGKTVALSSQYSGLSLWDRDARRVWRRARNPKNYDAATLLSWSSDGKMLHVGSLSGVLYLRPETGAPAFTFENTRWNGPFSVSADELHRAAWSLSGVDLWQAREKSPRVHIDFSTAWNIEVISQDLTRMVARSLLGVDRFWDLATGKQSEPLPAQIIGGYHSTWSPHLDLWAHVERRNLQVLRLPGASVLHASQLPAGWYSLDATSWSPDGQSLIVRGDHGTSSVVVALPAGHAMQLPSGNGTLVWGPSGALVRLPGPPTLFVPQTPDRKWAVAIDSASETLKAWDVSRDPPAPGPEIHIPGIRGDESRLTLSPDGKRIARISAKTVVDIWDLAAAQIVERWTAPGSSGLQSLVWQDKLTAVDSLGGAVRLWQAP